MATAEELLSGMSTGDDTTLVIDNYSRTIHIPNRITNLGVEHDDEVLFLNFKMARYLDDTDLSKFSIRINYINANGDSDAYTVKEDKKVVGENFIKFSWQVGPTATAYKGTTKFIVCMKTMKTVDGQQVIDKEYNTTVASLPVLEGLEVDESIVTQYSDIIEQWREEIFGVTNSEIQKIKTAAAQESETLRESVEEVKASIPNDYTKTSQLAEESIRTRADAIKNTAEGELIRVSDSSDDHLRGLRIFGKTTQVSTTGKQLANNILSTFKTNGITFTSNPDGSVHIYGTATGHAYYVFDQNNTILVKNTELIASLSGSPKVSMVVGYYKVDGSFVNDIATVNYTVSKTFVYPDEAVLTRTFLAVNEGISLDATVYPMIRLATISDDSYEPYSGGFGSPSLDWPQEMNSVGMDGNNLTKIQGKNLVNIHATPDATLAATATVTGDSVTVATTDDTSLSRAVYKVDYPLNVPLTISFDATILELGSTSAGSTVRLRKSDRSAGIIMLDLNAVGIKKHYEITANPLTEEGYELWLYLRTFSDATGKISVKFENVQVEIGDKCTDYDPYKTTQSINIDRDLPGIPVDSGGNYTDSTGQQWICDEVDFERGVYVQRVGRRTFTGTESWGLGASVLNGMSRHYTWVNDMRPDNSGFGLCTHYPRTPFAAEQIFSECVRFGQNNVAVFFFSPTIRTTEEWVEYVMSLKDAGTPISILYVLATPVETPLVTAELEAFKTLCSNYPHTTVRNNAAAHMELTYNVDTKTYVDNGIKQTVSEVMEAIENGSY